MLEAIYGGDEAAASDPDAVSRLAVELIDLVRLKPGTTHCTMTWPNLPSRYDVVCRGAYMGLVGATMADRLEADAMDARWAIAETLMDRAVQLQRARCDLELVLRVVHDLVRPFMWREAEEVKNEIEVLIHHLGFYVTDIEALVDAIMGGHAFSLNLAHRPRLRISAVEAAIPILLGMSSIVLTERMESGTNVVIDANDPMRRLYESCCRIMNYAIHRDSFPDYTRVQMPVSPNAMGHPISSSLWVHTGMNSAISALSRREVPKFMFKAIDSTTSPNINDHDGLPAWALPCSDFYFETFRRLERLGDYIRWVSAETVQRALEICHHLEIDPGPIESLEFRLRFVHGAFTPQLSRDSSFMVDLLVHDQYEPELRTLHFDLDELLRSMKPIQ